MKVAFISTFESAGGAARSAHSLYRQLNQMDVDCRMLVQYKQSNDSRVIAPTGWISHGAGFIRPYLDALPVLFYRSRLSPPWSLAWLPNNVPSMVSKISPEIIHLHGIGHGFLSLDEIAHLNKPIIWTLHDSWAFTGGCHLPGGCERFFDRCGYCPQLNARHESDLSRWGWCRKTAIWPQLDVTFVTPSHWLAGRAASSSLLGSKKIEVIPNGIDTTRFTPCDRGVAKAALGLPHDEYVVLYGAAAFTTDDNKGFHLIQEALKLVIARKTKKKMTLVLFGDTNYKETEFQGISVRSYGSVSSEDQLVTIYGAADIFVLPSLQENLPNTVMEAMSCGTPCIAFDVGGVGDLISHGENGYLAKACSQHELAEGIMWMLSDPDRRAVMGHRARQTIESGFAIKRVAERYRTLYEFALAGNRQSGSQRSVNV